MPLFITVLIICIISRSESDFFIPCMADLQKSFSLSPFAAQFAHSFNFVGYCAGGLIAGFMGDRFSYRLIILWCLAIFAAATLICALSFNYYILLAGRFLQGLSIAGPTVLSYVILIEHQKFQEQLTRLGLINGLITLLMTTVPTIGGHLGLYANWRFNFLAVLSLAVIAIILGYFNIKNDHKLPSGITLSMPFRDYFKILQSRKLLLFTSALCLIITPYWVFISMAPIYYINDLGVPLIKFIWYKNILALIFGIISLANGHLSKQFGCKNCFFFSIIACLISISGMFFLIITETEEPEITIAIMAILTVGTAFLINYLYAHALISVNNHLGKVSAVIHSVRLIFTSFSLAIVSKAYTGNFFAIGSCLICMLTLGLLMTMYLYKAKLLKTRV